MYRTQPVVLAQTPQKQSDRKELSMLKIMEVVRRNVTLILEVNWSAMILKVIDQTGDEPVVWLRTIDVKPEELIVAANIARSGFSKSFHSHGPGTFQYRNRGWVDMTVVKDRQLFGLPLRVTEVQKLVFLLEEYWSD